MQAIHRRAKYVPALLLAMAGASMHAQQAQQPQQPAPGQPFTSRVELVTTDVVVRDNAGQFIADLKKEEFEVLEDGVPQKLISFSLIHGGRSYNIAAPPPAPVAEGIILPPTRPPSDTWTSGTPAASATCSRRSRRS
jgi:hypothetical protein